MNLVPDKESFPARTLFAAPASNQIAPAQLARYADKAELHYVYEGGIRVVDLQGITVTAAQRPRIESQLYDNSSVVSITEDFIEKNTGQNIYYLLNLLAGVQVNGKEILIRGGGSMSGLRMEMGGGEEVRVAGTPPLLLIDGVDMEIGDIDKINVHDIAQIDVLRGPEAAIFGVRGAQGIIIIHTKRGAISQDTTPQFYMKPLLPLGHQQPAEFYAPIYETQAQRNNPKPDVRTTIHWQPVVSINNQGVATFEFYTSDEPTSYTVTIEGVAGDGTIIRKVGTLTLL
jgi:TonB-dependent SusC/RagA subfamily outer membrane receptor